jgi:hypothetical protein
LSWYMDYQPVRLRMAHTAQMANDPPRAHGLLR